MTTNRPLAHHHFVLVLFILFTSPILHDSAKATPLVRNPHPSTTATTPLYRAEIVLAHPHSTNSFTEGFGFVPRSLLGQNVNPVVYESTGLYHTDKPASIALTDYHTDRAILSRDLTRGLFAEGCTIGGQENKIIYLATLSSNKIFAFDAVTLQPTGIVHRFPSNSEILHGWGLTSNPDTQVLYVSDGTSQIHMVSIDPDQEEAIFVGTIHVHDGDTPIRELNELEWVNGLIYANVLGQSCIVKILPETGDVVGWVSLAKALQKYPHIGTNEVLLRQMNGIAYDPFSKVLLVTGKLWPLTFEIKEGVPLVGPTANQEINACRPETMRKVDNSMIHAGINNKLPYISMMTDQEARENWQMK
jgi:glutamine cyclotransferase